MHILRHTTTIGFPAHFRHLFIQLQFLIQFCPEKLTAFKSDTFFPRNFLGRHLHYWVGVPSAYQTDLRGGKQKKKKKKKKKARKN